ncbi:DUF1194 domain-containing protein [Aestuariivirga litoralis]|uniref:DUF1194 domain-containing protein n=1 Tax=Aestuariivirga litoralis TaxID=2650924 RepID=UPI0018C818A3|nr:DUF1194 domain-containing protein [Aestuariivirga litoralis]MBG1232272.1 DUF1194 domain-containing protein [Aestuariivirga litoralis]
MSFTRRAVLTGLGATALTPSAEAALAVDLALVLAIDCSYSVDPYEYQVQMRGTGQAFRQPEILEAVRSGPKKQIAVSSFLWSAPDTITVLLPWQLLRNAADATNISNFFFQAPRGVERGTTATGSALLYAQGLLDTAPKAARHVIDISTDGTCNEGPPVQAVRDALVEKGTVINGLAITTDVYDLVDYLTNNVMGGHNSFVLKANRFEDYGRTLREKLFKEITNVDVN